jgi:hypothetical protein
MPIRPSTGSEIAARLSIGIDTLTMLSTGDSGWRPADRLLRAQYPDVRNSVVNPNYLKGSMALSGLAVSHELRNEFTDIAIIETHPKVLYFELCVSAGAQNRPVGREGSRVVR